ncbi:DctQ-like TRAP transporter [Afipia sp. Root123D2]|uniref:TRAP transporter small permease subunit n=1 Tax=Afipia sp. Root123D2 TaxID=1736436 RepID=UPI0006F24111|nr:TRAP transporter small permease subunit [Afipia sp. Root123D2]KQW21905.1 DctQ-like TRAP transporter [Afipia sp. Root123D2]
MPNLYFVLPHWLYWGTLIVFPLIAIYLVNRQLQRGVPRGPSVFIAYMFWLFAGFMGLHRFYLKSRWGFAFVPVFLALLYVNGLIGDRREDVSRTRAAVETSHIEISRARISPNETATPEATERLAKATAAGKDAEAQFKVEEQRLDDTYGYSRWLAILMAAMMVVDAILLPGLVRRTAAREASESQIELAEIPDIPAQGTGEDPAKEVHTWLTDKIEWVNVRTGEFVAYWAVISVFVYYYEVIARYAFNSPTNWVHESMFLMYGMQYMLAGAYAYREDQHVRVDVFYTKFSPRGKAMADIFTSIFFFIFIGVMFWTSWRFAADSVANGERSFTEWQVQYWPIKLMMPIGAGLLLLQGVAKLIKDIVFLTRGRA